MNIKAKRRDNESNKLIRYTSFNIIALFSSYSFSLFSNLQNKSAIWRKISSTTFLDK